MTALLQLDALRCSYPAHTAISDFSLQLDQRAICALIGPSGCGKTTLLRAIAGFHPLSAGAIYLGDRLLSSRATQIPPEARGIGMVFQDYALFPHLSVAQNICFGITHLDKASQREVLTEMLNLVKLGALEQRFPHELSGGQCQRVALARALARRPSLLLLDEPFSNLDTELRQTLSLEVRQILRECSISAILVTHDQQEAFAFADHVGVLHRGRLQQWDSPYNLYHEPVNRFVADFIGRGSFLPGTLLTAECVDTELGPLWGNRSYTFPRGCAVDVLIRPDDITLAEHDQAPVRVTVSNKVFCGSATLYTLRLSSGTTVETLLPSHHDYGIGEPMAIRADLAHLIVFPAQGELA